MNKAQVAQDAVSATPHVAATGALVTLAQDLDLVIKILGLVYIVLQIALVVYKGYVLRKTKKDDE